MSSSRAYKWLCRVESQVREQKGIVVVRRCESLTTGHVSRLRLRGGINPRAHVFIGWADLVHSQA